VSLFVALRILNVLAVVPWLLVERIVRVRGGHWYTLDDCRLVLLHVPRGRKVVSVERLP
jgi:hypothetical protein